MRPKWVLVSSIGFLAAVIGISILLTSGQKTPPNTVSYSAKDTDKPVAETPQTSADFGKIKGSDTKQQDFALKNSGTRPLQILNINSSCDCTFGQLIYNGTTSKEYGMQAQSGYLGDIAPGGMATIRVIYRPYIMPLVGPVERDVYLTTNDPSRTNLTFSIKANVT